VTVDPIASLPLVERILDWLNLRRRYRITRIALFPDQHGFKLALMPEIENRTTQIQHLDQAFIQFFFDRNTYSPPFEVRLRLDRFSRGRSSREFELLPGEQKRLYLVDPVMAREISGRPRRVRIVVTTLEERPYVRKLRLRWSSQSNMLLVDEVNLFFREGDPEPQDPAPDELARTTNDLPPT
jgi:hypothetical protein